MTFKSYKHKDKRGSSIGNSSLRNRVKLAQEMFPNITIPLVGMFFDQYADGSGPSNSEIQTLATDIAEIAKKSGFYAIYNNEDLSNITSLHDYLTEHCRQSNTQ
jgi:hypothetical protein